MILGLATGLAWLTTISPSTTGLAQAPTPAAAAMLQDRVRSAIATTSPAVVAVQGAGGPGGALPPDTEYFASGVIITPEGHVLSQRHVTHVRDPFDATKDAKAGDTLQIVLHDGRRVTASILGSAPQIDISLLKITEPGPFPFAEVDPKVGAELGQWVVKGGHPGGYVKGRAISFRLGKAVAVSDGAFVSDCLTAGGDSGGPLFGLDGRLLGIIHTSGGIPSAALGEAPTSDTLFSVIAVRTIAPLLPELMRGETIAIDQDDLSTSVEQLKAASALPGRQWKQGSDAQMLYRSFAEVAEGSVVSVTGEIGQLVLGTIVDAEGLIITKASELRAPLRCRLNDGEELPASILGIDPAYDIALLKVDRANLRPITWSSATELEVGSLVAAATSVEHDDRWSPAIISSGRRKPSGPFPRELAAPLPRGSAAPPEIIGSAVEGRCFWVEYVDGMAKEAGIVPGDVLLRIGDRAVRSTSDLADAVDGLRDGDTVTAELWRNAMNLSLRLRLRGKVPRKFNRRASDFPVVFEHDAAIAADQCGGPLVDLSGAAVGVTIARSGPHGCTAIPADAILAILGDLKEGRPIAELPMHAPTQPSPEPAAEAAPEAGITLDELTQHLTWRRERFRSLLVEYDLRSEAHVDPIRLMQWRLHSIRDYRESHVIAFAGDKQRASVTRPDYMTLYAPMDQLTPDPEAPPEIIRAVEVDRRVGESRRLQGNLSYLSAGTEMRIDSAYDGQRLLRWNEHDGRFSRAPVGQFYAPVMYLANIGLRPVDPGADERTRDSQRRMRYPDALEGFDEIRLLPEQHRVDGAWCVVIEGHRSVTDGAVKRYEITERIAFDPELGYAPRLIETTLGGVLNSTRSNFGFDEFEPGCWLPRRATWTRMCPEWTAAELRGKPAYSYVMELRRAQVNDVEDSIFAPASVSQR